MTTQDKLAQARIEISEAMHLLDNIQLGQPTSLTVAQVRKRLSPAMAKLESVESELSLEEERNRS